MKDLINSIPLPKEWWSDSVCVFHCDNMELLQYFPDGAFHLASIDPPYGIGENGKSNHSRGKLAKSKQYTEKDWDNEPPPPEFFSQLFRVSKEQIIWGANHFIENLPKQNSPCWIVWDKDNGKTDFADCELAWGSFGTTVRKFKFKWQGMLQGNMKNKEKRIHQTQKPVPLYNWLLDKYAEPSPGFYVIDTHLGSASHAIAAHFFGCLFVGCEKDPEHYADGKKRFQNEILQIKLKF